MGNRKQIYNALHDFIGNDYKDPEALFSLVSHYSREL